MQEDGMAACLSIWPSLYVSIGRKLQTADSLTVTQAQGSIALLHSQTTLNTIACQCCVPQSETVQRRYKNSAN